MGIGVNAVSYISGIRSRNTNSIDEYISMVSGDTLPVIEEEKLEGRKKLSERLILGLRLTDGIKLLPEDRVFIDKLKNLQSLGLVENHSRSKWQLTPRGTLLANHVFRELI
jgi:oxygen-independent coproporphyrinogen-3 oxidase